MRLVPWIFNWGLFHRALSLGSYLRLCFFLLRLWFKVTHEGHLPIIAEAFGNFLSVSFKGPLHLYAPEWVSPASTEPSSHDLCSSTFLASGLKWMSQSSHFPHIPGLPFHISGLWLPRLCLFGPHPAPTLITWHGTMRSNSCIYICKCLCVRTFCLLKQGWGNIYRDKYHHFSHI